MTDQKTALKNSTGKSSGFMGKTSTKSLARKHETNQYNTAKLSQPMPNRAVPKHRPESWEKVVNMYRNIDRTLTNAAIWKFTDNSRLTEERMGFRFQGMRGHKTAHSTSPLDSSCSEGEKEQLMKRIHEPKPSLQMLHTSFTYTIKMFLSWFLSRLHVSGVHFSAPWQLWLCLRQ